MQVRLTTNRRKKISSTHLSFRAQVYFEEGGSALREIHVDYTEPRSERVRLSSMAAGACQHGQTLEKIMVRGHKTCDTVTLVFSGPATARALLEDYKPAKRRPKRKQAEEVCPPDV